ncbi:MAG: hypothetical protein OJF49_004017 [Ktedonobacterales bacterium]|jgi:hypothetical protein|nr:MAG: hypothetical protein OJF49_004017 [Ktedonobacterales bacterium]
MNVYALVLFVHVCGAIGTFAGMSIWLFGVSALRRARSVEQVRTITGLMTLSDPLTVTSILLLAAAGLYLAIAYWGLQTPWIDVAMASFILIAPIGPAIVEPRIKAIGAVAKDAPDGPLSPQLLARTHSTVVATGLHTIVAALLGIVFLMTNKPPLTESILVMVVAFGIGIISGLSLWLAARARARHSSTAMVK